MASDDMYLENLDEYINDENRVVTYKWLSRTLAVHVNQAKQMLHSFVDHQRNTKDNDHLTVTYFVAGVAQDEHGTELMSMQIVPEEMLESTKSALKKLTSCHVYSVQKNKLKESNVLYTADYDLLKEQIFNSNKYSAITCTTAKLRSVDDLQRLHSRPADETVHEKQATKSHPEKTANGQAAAPSKPSQSAKSKPGIAGMFAKAEQKKTQKKNSDQKPAESGKKQEKEQAKSKPKQGGVMSFFAKQAAKPKKQEDIDKKEEKEKTTEEKPHTSDSSSKQVKPAPSRGKKNKAASSDEEPLPQQKRRRIKAYVPDTSSEEEEEDMEVEPEEPIPSPPPRREPSPQPRDPSPIPVSSDEEKETDTSKKNTHQAEPESKSASGKKRKMKKKLVSKTYVDDEGCMVTEKVWENQSTDVSDEEMPEPEKAVPTKQQKITPKEQTTTKKGGANKKTSPQGKSKQTSMMNFFKKK